MASAWRGAPRARASRRSRRPTAASSDSHKDAADDTAVVAVVHAPGVPQLHAFAIMRCRTHQETLGQLAQSAGGAVTQHQRVWARIVEGELRHLGAGVE